MSSPVLTTEAVRNLSERAFRSRYRIEVALAILKLDETFVYEELWEVVAEASRASGVGAPLSEQGAHRASTFTGARSG
jgi:hypothetical protein